MLIYKCRNKLNNKVYIGQTIKTLEYRKKKHYRDCNSYNFKFYIALKKYKKCDFEWCVIDTANNIKCLNKKEIYWIAYYNSFKEGYNSTIGGGGTSGYSHSTKTKDKMKGRKISVETRNAVSKSNAERVISIATKEKMTKSHLKKHEGENNGNSKIKENDALNIIELFYKGITTSEIAKLHNISDNSVRDIISGRTWKHIDRSHIKDMINHNRSIKLMESEVVEIIYILSLKKYTYLDIAKMYGVSASTVRDISKNKSWKHIERL